MSDRVVLHGRPKSGCSPMPARASDFPPMVYEPTLHQVNDVGVQHSFTKQDGVWTCACGAQRDRNGRDIS